MRIYFDKLLNGEYPLEIEMEMINWFLETGNKFDKYTSKWYKDGVSKQMFDYSANSNDACFPFPITTENIIGSNSYGFKVLEGFIQNCLFNAIVKKPTIPVKEWREYERVGVGKYRILDFPTDYPQEKDYEGFYRSLLSLRNYVGANLDKDKFHKDYKDRTNPKITKIKLYTNGRGYVFEYVFSFEKFGYESGWSQQIRQFEGQSLDMFMQSIKDTMKEVIIP